MSRAGRGWLRRHLVPAVCLVSVAGGLLASPAVAGNEDLRVPPSKARAPKGYERTVEEVEATARETEAVRSERRLHPDLRATTYTDEGNWRVSWYAGDEERAQVIVSDATGRVTEAWTGAQVAWRMARGYPGAFGRKLNAPYVWIPLCVLFLAPFFDPRRPFRVLHLDLLVLVGFGVSHFFFNRAQIDLSVPLVYPVLLYLLARMLWLGARPRAARGRLVPIVPLTWLVIATLFLVGFRIALNVADSNVIDVGYAGVIGADHIVDGDPLYGDGFHAEVDHGDTYGPVNYLAYLPFEEALGWSGEWDALPAAHGASIAFDLAVLLGLVALGRRLRAGEVGRRLGATLAFAWVAYPYSTFALESNSNDALVAALVVWALVAIASPAGRGALLGLASAVKFAPLALAPLFARGVDPAHDPTSPGGYPASPHDDATNADSPAVGPSLHSLLRPALVFTAALAAVLAATFLPFVPDGGLNELFDRTIAYQAGRDSPFSVWGQYSGIVPVHDAAKVLAATLALALFVLPRRRDLAQVAALGAAALIAVQLTVDHWFYLYIAWFAPLALAAIFARHEFDQTQRSGTRPEPRERIWREGYIRQTS